VIDDVLGVAFTVQREIPLGEQQRWRVSSTLRFSFLVSGLYEQVFFAHTTTVSLTPRLSYDVLRFKKVTIAPYLGPSGIWLAAITAEDLDFPGGPFVRRRVNRLMPGLELGGVVRITFTERFDVKIVPLSIQYGERLFQEDSFRQGSIALAFRL
jgi:hypothetical protein